MLIPQQQGEKKNRDANQYFPIFLPFPGEAKYGTVSEAGIRAQVGTASRFSMSWTKQRTFRQRYFRKTNTCFKIQLKSGEGRKRIELCFFTLLVGIWTEKEERQSLKGST